MPYSSTSRLPASVRNTLPKGAQTIYRKAFDNAWEEYKDSAKRRGRASREEAAHKVAWSAVKTKYQKNGEGKWSTRGISATKSTAAKPSGSTARAAKAKSAAGEMKRKSTRKSPVKARTKSASVKTKTAAKSSDGRTQARWKAAATSKTKATRGSRAKTATGRRAKVAETSQQKPRKSRRSVSATAAQRQESVNMSVPSQEAAVGLPAEVPQSEASQAV